MDGNLILVRLGKAILWAAIFIGACYLVFSFDIAEFRYQVRGIFGSEIIPLALLVGAFYLFNPLPKGSDSIWIKLKSPLLILAIIFGAVIFIRYILFANGPF